MQGQRCFTAHERRIIAQLARSAIPAGELLAGGGQETAARVEDFMARSPATQRRVFRLLLWLTEIRALGTKGRPFCLLGSGDQEDLLRSWQKSPLFVDRLGLRALSAAPT